MKLKYTGITLLVLITGIIGWMGLVREPLPPIPEISRVVSNEVSFDFSIESMNYNKVELALDQKIKGKGMFIQFGMANAWKTGRAGLVLNGISGRSSLSGMSPQKYLDDPKRKEQKSKDFSDFMKDRSGRSLSGYSFNQKLVEGQGGQPYMLISYNGPAMEMIQTLEIPRPITLPAHVSSLFTEKGIIQFKPGTVSFDGKSKGFYIPVQIH